MGPVSQSPSAVEREIANIRCLVAQQLVALECRDLRDGDARAADVLLRQLLRRDEDLRRGLVSAAGDGPAARLSD